MTAASFVYSHDRARRATRLLTSEEMQIESESSIDTRDLLPRDGPLTYNRHGSLVALVAEDESMPETQENAVEADERVKTKSGTMIKILHHDLLVASHRIP